MIRTKTFENHQCLKCNKIEKYMIKIGAITMCIKCFEEEFNIEEIKYRSSEHEKYYRWLKKYNDI